MKAFSRYALPAGIFLMVLLIGVPACKDSSTGPGGPDTGGPGGGSGDFSHISPAGASAVAFLTDGRFTSLEIEVDYMEGYEPTPEAISGLQNFLEARLNKTSIAITTTEIPAGGKTTYSLNEVRGFEEDHRDNYTDGDGNILHAYLIVLDGQYNQNNVLGIAFYNTSAALFGGKIKEISGSPPVNPSREKVEGTVLNHEFGHLLGLVGSGTPPQSDHKDPNSAHCTNESCLMNATIETANFFDNFSGEVPTLDADCIDDLQANGGQ